MPRKAKIVNINDDSTYGEVAEAIVENELAAKPRNARRNRNTNGGT